MHIAMIGPVVHSWGGTARSGGVSTYTVGLSSALAELGVEISLLGDNTDASEGSLQLQIPKAIHYDRMHRLSASSLLPTTRALGLPRLIRTALRLARTGSLDIPWGQRLRYLDRAANYDKFLEPINPQILHVAHAEFRQYLCQQVVRAQDPVVASVLSATVFIRPTPEWLRQMTANNYNLAARLLPCSNFVKEMITPYVERPERMVVIPNGTDVDKFHPSPKEIARRHLGLDLDEFIFLFTGSLVRPKGVDILLQAFLKQFSGKERVRLVFVGSGSEKENLEQMARQSEITSQVTLAGYQTDESMPEWYAACDVFVLPSQSEGLSGSILEAMASARAIITTYPDMGDHDAVEQGVNGLLVLYGDVEALADSLGSLYRSPEMVNQMGAASRRKAEQHFSWQAVAHRVREVYREVLVEKGEA